MCLCHELKGNLTQENEHQQGPVFYLKKWRYWSPGLIVTEGRHLQDRLIDTIKINAWLEVKPQAAAAGRQWSRACRWQERRKSWKHVSWTSSSAEERRTLRWGRRHWSTSHSRRKNPKLELGQSGALKQNALVTFLWGNNGLKVDSY